jgi:hypothetical protein
MDPINIPQMLAYIPYITRTMDPMGIYIFLQSRHQPSTPGCGAGLKVLITKDLGRLGGLETQVLHHELANDLQLGDAWPSDLSAGIRPIILPK